MLNHSHFASARIVSIVFATFLSISQANASEETINPQRTQMRAGEAAQPLDENSASQPQDRRPAVQTSTETSGEELLSFLDLFNKISYVAQKTIFNALELADVCSFMQTNKAIFERATGDIFEVALQKKGFDNPPSHQPFASCSHLSLRYVIEDSTWILSISESINRKLNNLNEIPSYYLYKLVTSVSDMPQAYWQYLPKTHTQTATFTKAITDDEVIKFGSNLQGSKIRVVFFIYDESFKQETLKRLKDLYPSIHWSSLYVCATGSFSMDPGSTIFVTDSVNPPRIIMIRF